MRAFLLPTPPPLAFKQMLKLRYNSALVFTSALGYSLFTLHLSE